MRIIVVTSCLLVVCFAQCGTYTSPNGYLFDLDPLTTNQDYNGTDEYPYFTYKWNFCKNVTDVCPEPAPAVQISSSNYCFYTGYLPGVVSSHPYGEEKGVVVTYVGSQFMCRGISRISNFILTCDANTAYQLNNITEDPACNYTFLIQTKYACPSTSTTSSSSSSSGTPDIGKVVVPLWISAISSIVIILLVVVIIIIAVLSKVKGYTALRNGK